MAGEDDDYLGDLSQFLPPEIPMSSSTKRSSGKVEVLKSSNKTSRAQGRHEQKRFKQERKQTEDDQLTAARLDSPIPQSNIGFKLLKQMGYNPGSGLGKESSGIAEPIGLQIRRGRYGVGKEDPKKEKMRKELENAERDKRKVEALMEDYGVRQKERWRGKRIVVNFLKAEGALAQLENRDVAEVEKKDIEDEEKEEEEEEEEEVITEEDLLNILMRLRTEFKYCLFCGFQYDTEEALLTNCPGINEDDH